MKIGAVFPHLDIGNDPAVIRDWAQTAEGLGYSQILSYAHVVGAVHEGRQPPPGAPARSSRPFTSRSSCLAVSLRAPPKSSCPLAS